MTTSLTDAAPSWFLSAVSTSSDSSAGINKTKSLDDSTTSHTCSLLMTTSLSSPKMVSAGRKRRPVQFDDRAEALVVHHLEPLEEDPQQLWFSKQEIKALRAEGKATLAKVNEAGGDLSLLDEAMGESIRGLEHGLSVYDREGSSSTDGDNNDTNEKCSLDRSQRRKNIVATILLQQYEQKESGIDYDPKGLQVTSNACTQWARDRAMDQAQKDFDEAVLVWKEDAQCSALLPSILNKNTTIHSNNIRRSKNLLLSSSEPPPKAPKQTENERKQTLDIISRTVASALEELDDLDF